MVLYEQEIKCLTAQWHYESINRVKTRSHTFAIHILTSNSLNREENILSTNHSTDTFSPILFAVIQVTISNKSNDWLRKPQTIGPLFHIILSFT